MSAAILATRTAGSGDGAILWIHGYTLDSGVWARSWSELPGWRHVGIDLPGHGRSQQPPDGVSVNEVAEAVVEIGRQHGAEHLVAMSFGGIVALEAAIVAPHAFRTLTLASPALGGGPQEPAAQTRNLALIRMYGERGRGPWLTDLWMRSPPDIFTGAARHPRLLAELREVVGRYRWTELRDDWMTRVMRTSHHPARLAAIRAATLVLIGDRDMQSFARSAQLIRRGVSCGRVHRIPDAGHLCLLERPAECALLISGHLTEHAAPTAVGRAS